MNFRPYRLLLSALLALAATHAVQALSITPTSGVLNTSRWQGDETGQAFINTILAGIFPAGTLELYKQDVGQAEANLPLKDSYKTTFSNSPSDPSTALIEYTGGPIVSPTAYGLVKGGGPANAAPFWYLFDLTALGWNGTDSITYSGFWPNQGAISHVTLYGKQANQVPEGGSALVLLGLSLAFLGFARRKLA